MKKPEHITFTGVDDQTALDEMRRLSERYPIEWGVLFSPSRQGVDPRYPNGETLSRLLWSKLKMAAHLCGDYSRNVMAGAKVDIPVDLYYFSRIQINSATPDARRINTFRKGWGVKNAIAQHREGPFPKGEVDWLFDKSGGTGATPDAWPQHPGQGQFVGYAGGINPENVLDVIGAIDADGQYWIDMESGVRTNNVFDLQLCRQVCEAVYG
jgi:hypothetical protein